MSHVPSRFLIKAAVAAAALLGSQLALGQAADRSGEEVVKLRCAQCHEKGVNGAPRIGELSAWTPRFKNGIDNAIRSAIRGHGKMPARGGLAELTDVEMRNAVVYMFDPASAIPRKPQAAAPAATDAMHKLVAGTDIYLGVLPAERMRERKGKPPLAVPGGRGYFHVSVVLRDSASKAEVKDAEIEARVANLMTGESKKLAAVSYDDVLSYANYFQMPGKDPYTVTLKITKPGAAPIEAKFDLKR